MHPSVRLRVPRTRARHAATCLRAGDICHIGLTRVPVEIKFEDGSHIFCELALMIQHHTVSLKEVNYQIAALPLSRESAQRLKHGSNCSAGGPSRKGFPHRLEPGLAVSSSCPADAHQTADSSATAAAISAKIFGPRGRLRLHLCWSSTAPSPTAAAMRPISSSSTSPACHCPQSSVDLFRRLWQDMPAMT